MAYGVDFAADSSWAAYATNPLAGVPGSYSRPPGRIEPKSLNLLTPTPYLMEIEI
jgi:hypothetical protein